jgi:hypothetical protein
MTQCVQLFEYRKQKSENLIILKNKMVSYFTKYEKKLIKKVVIA